MANEIAVRQAEVVLSPADAAKYARAFYGSSVFKSGGTRLSTEEIFVVIMAGQEYGWGPAASMSNLNLMDGRPELSADAQARFIKAGGKYEYRVTEHTDEACELTILDAKTGEIIGVERYTMDDAKRMGVKMTTSGGRPTNWAKVPRNMLFARCVSNACAFHCPDAVPMRTYTVGEIDSENRDEETERPALTPEQAAELQGIEGTVEAAIEAEAEELPDEPVEEMTEASEPGSERIGQVHLDRIPEGEDPLYVRFVEDSARLNQGQKNLVRQLCEEAGVPFKTSEIVKMMKAKGFTDVVTWLAFAGSGRPAEPVPEPEPQVYLPSGIEAMETGGQTATRTITDDQMKKWHARCGELGLNNDEKHNLLRHYIGVSSSKSVPMEHFDELMLVLDDLSKLDLTDEAVRTAYHL